MIIKDIGLVIKESACIKSLIFRIDSLTIVCAPTTKAVGSKELQLEPTALVVGRKTHPEPTASNPYHTGTLMEFRGILTLEHWNTGTLEPGTWNLEPETWNLEPWNPGTQEPGTWNPGTWNLETHQRDPGSPGIQFRSFPFPEHRIKRITGPEVQEIPSDPGSCIEFERLQEIIVVNSGFVLFR